MQDVDISGSWAKNIQELSIVFVYFNKSKITSKVKRMIANSQWWGVWKIGENSHELLVVIYVNTACF